MADSRLFRMVRADATFEYGQRRNLAARLGGGGNWQHGRIVMVHATNLEATAGWTDVTAEFLGENLCDL